MNDKVILCSSMCLAIAIAVIVTGYAYPLWFLLIPAIVYHDAE